MRLKTLTLKNFKGVESYTLTPNPKGHTSVFADNGKYKTTLFDAFTFLLFGKDSLGAKDFEIKAKTPGGESVHNLEHTVEGVFDSDGQEKTLKRTYKEVYPKKHGTATRVFSGHTTKYEVDGKKGILEKDYKNEIAAICSEDRFQMLTDPRFFNDDKRMPWKKRRDVLFGLCDDISAEDEAEIKSKEDEKKTIKARQAEINEAIDQIPVRIDEATAGKVTVRAKKSVDDDLTLHEGMLKEGKSTLSEVEAGG
ncbi:hypothetical protein LCGC14_1707860, partial [marine sediment metagenome]